MDYKLDSIIIILSDWPKYALALLLNNLQCLILVPNLAVSQNQNFYAIA